MVTEFVRTSEQFACSTGTARFPDSKAQEAALNRKEQLVPYFVAVNTQLERPLYVPS
jgi:hypothetical protein